jgi:hypothetical protein
MREPILLGLPLERAAVDRPGRFFAVWAVSFVFASYLIGWLIDQGSI